MLIHIDLVFIIANIIHTIILWSYICELWDWCCESGLYNWFDMNVHTHVNFIQCYILPVSRHIRFLIIMMLHSNYKSLYHAEDAQRTCKLHSYDNLSKVLTLSYQWQLIHILWYTCGQQAYYSTASCTSYNTHLKIVVYCLAL